MNYFDKINELRGQLIDPLSVDNLSSFIRGMRFVDSSVNDLWVFMSDIVEGPSAADYATKKMLSKPTDKSALNDMLKEMSYHYENSISKRDSQLSDLSWIDEHIEIIRQRPGLCLRRPSSLGLYNQINGYLFCSSENELVEFKRDQYKLFEFDAFVKSWYSASSSHWGSIIHSFEESNLHQVSVFVGLWDEYLANGLV